MAKLFIFDVSGSPCYNPDMKLDRETLEPITELEKKN